MIFINPSILQAFAPWAIWKGNNLNSVYITFDDGPDPKYTSRVLKILQNQKTKAVFFLNGSKVEKYPDVVRDIQSENHIIGNHGFSHQSLLFKPKQIVMNEINQTNEAIHACTGSMPHLFRPPYGRFDFRFNKWLESLNMQLVMWSLLTFDFRASTPDKLMHTVRHHLHNRAILVFHDGHSNSEVMVQALPDILDFIHYQCLVTNDPLFPFPKEFH